MKIKEWIVEIVVLIAALIISITGCRQNMLTKEEIIDIANREARSQGLQLDKEEVYYDVGNVESKDVITSIRKTNPDFANRFSVLEGRDYQAVIYKPPGLGEYVLGGAFYIFVDRKTGKVITVFGEK